MKKIFIFVILIILLFLSVFLLKERGIFFRKEEQANLDKFYQLTKLDPLFYSPFVNLKELEKSIKNLKDTEDKFFEDMSFISDDSNSEDQALYEEIYNERKEKGFTVFPYLFLESLAPTISLTERFLADSSFNSAENLADSYYKTAKAYKEEVDKKVNLIEELKEKRLTNLNRYFFFVDSATSYGVVKNDFLLIQENASRLLDEAQRRKKCLFSGENCEIDRGLTPSSINPSDLTTGQARRAPRKDLEAQPLVDYEVGAKKELPPQFLSDEFLTGNKGIEKKGPYQVKSSCWQGEKDWLYLSFKERDNLLRANFKLATNNYYTDVSNMGKSSRYVQELRNRGFKFASQLETTDYECLNLEYYFEVSALDFLIEKLKTGGYSLSEAVFGDAIKGLSLDLADLVSKGQILEEKLISDRYPDYEDFKKLGEIYSAIIVEAGDDVPTTPPDASRDVILNPQGEESQDSSSPPAHQNDDVASILKYKLLIENKFPRLPEILNFVSGNLEVLGLHRKFENQITPPDYIFILRSDYSIFYFPFAKSIWRIKEKPKYLLAEDEKPRIGALRFVSFDYLKEKGYSEEKIKSFYLNDYQFISSLVE